MMKVPVSRSSRTFPIMNTCSLIAPACRRLATASKQGIEPLEPLGKLIEAARRTLGIDDEMRRDGTSPFRMRRTDRQ